MQKTILIALALGLLSACAPSPQVIGTAIAQTQAAAATSFPVSAPTPVSIKDLDLAQEIFLPLGLPAGFAASPTRSNAAGEADLAGFETRPVNQFWQDLSYQGVEGSRVSISLFETSEQAAMAYEYLYSRLKGYGQSLEERHGPGAKSFGYGQSETASPGSKVVFVRCRALVVAGSNAEAAYSVLIDYAFGLDERLSDFICQ
jgi:hypothetical protein